MEQRRAGYELDNLAEDVKTGIVDTVMVGFTDLYGRLMGKRVDAQFFVDDVVGHGTHACDYLFTVNMAMEPTDGYAFAGWHLGYGDMHLVPDLRTLRRAAWTSSTALVLCDVATGPSDAPVEIAPRQILRRQVERLAELGCSAKVASELEFYVYQDSYGDAAARGHDGLSRFGHYSEDYDLLQGHRHEPYVGACRRALAASGVPVENSKGETGVGQHELNIGYAEVVEMADRHIVMKQAMKEIAIDQGLSVTFMAKPSTDDAGSSCHLHLSLWDEGRNAFVAAPSEGGAEVSDQFRWFLGGWMRYVNELMVWYAPTVNSYKRFVDGSWAPTRIAWARDNRTAGFRIVGDGEHLRIECRIPGADCNPYLAYAAALAAGIAGIEERIEPPPEYVGDVYVSDEFERVPSSLHEAVQLWSTSGLARSAFGDAVVEHYQQFYRTEWAQFANAVTDWERGRYFERI